MKKISIIIIGCLLLASCVVKTKGADGKDGTDGQISNSIIITDLDIREVVSYLASDSIKGRNTGSQGIEASARFIQQKFKALAIPPYFETYRDSFTVQMSNDSLSAYNILGYIEGHDETLKDEHIIIGAHYDHIGYANKVVNNDSIANGANDNATGTAAVLALAKYFANAQSNKRSLIFALFSAEEIGLKGSNHLAKKLKEQELNIYTVVNFEMLGVPFKDRNYEAFLTGFSKSNMAEVINKHVNDTLIGFSDVSKRYGLFQRSDNYEFYRQFKVPSHTISSFDMTNYDYYHHADDEIEALNLDFTTEFMNKLIPGIEAISRTETQEIQLIQLKNND